MAGMGDADSDVFWIPVSDLMAGLMVIFMFIAIAYITNIALTYEELKSDLYKELQTEFEGDLEEWGAELERKTLTIRFEKSNVLFGQGGSETSPHFEEVLAEFFPRYLSIITKDKYRKEIEEVRIEGHTSSEWNQRVTGLDAYVRNMELSQDRTRTVLHEVMSLPEVQRGTHTEWLRRRLTANGMSSSRPITSESGKENPSKSRRVEFRIRTDAESQVRKALNDFHSNDATR